MSSETKSSAIRRTVHPEVLAGDPIAYAARSQANEELLEAARFAVRWFRQREQHAPPETEFGGEAEVEGRLRRAIVVQVTSGEEVN
jgi:hypothetical protein